MLTQILSTQETQSFVIFCRQLLYTSTTTSTVVRNVTVLSTTTDKLNRFSTLLFWGQVDI